MHPLFALILLYTFCELFGEVLNLARVAVEKRTDGKICRAGC